MPGIPGNPGGAPEAPGGGKGSPPGGGGNGRPPGGGTGKPLGPGGKGGIGGMPRPPAGGGIPWGNWPGAAPGIPGNGGGPPATRSVWLHVMVDGDDSRTWEWERWRESIARLVLRKHGVRMCLALGGVG